jgi:hypothetical protein
MSYMLKTLELLLSKYDGRWDCYNHGTAFTETSSKCAGVLTDLIRDR